MMFWGITKIRVVIIHVHTISRFHDFTSSSHVFINAGRELLFRLKWGKHVHLTPYCHILINLKNCDKSWKIMAPPSIHFTTY
jgi:hypothetical protein